MVRRQTRGVALTTGNVYLLRSTPGSQNEFYEWTPGTPKRIGPLTASTEPGSTRHDASALMREVLPEGTRLSGLRVFYMTIPVKAGTDDSNADRIIWDGQRWEVKGVLKWGENYEAFTILERACEPGEEDE